MSRIERGPESFSTDSHAEIQARRMAEERGRELTDLERSLLADPEDKGGLKKLAAEQMFNDPNVEAPIDILNKIKPEHWGEMKGLVGEFQAALAEKDSKTRKEKQKDIGRRVNKLINLSLESEE